MHTDQHYTNVVSPVVNSSDNSGRKTIKLEITHMMSQQRGYRETKRLLQQVSKVNETSQEKEKQIFLRQAQRY